MISKKILLYIFVLCAFACMACSRENKTTSGTNSETSSESPKETYPVESKNNIFTDKFFADVILIKTIPSIGDRQITAYDDILKVCQLFASLEFTEARKEEDFPEDSFEQITGTSAVTLRYEDNTEFHITFTGKYLYYDDMIYTLVPEQSENLFAELRNIFGD